MNNLCEMLQWFIVYLLINTVATIYFFGKNLVKIKPKDMTINNLEEIK